MTEAVLVAAVPVILGGAGWLIKHLLSVTKVLGEVKDQVANSHGSNLRDDLDFIRDLILDVKADTAWVRRDHFDLTRRVERLEAA